MQSVDAVVVTYNRLELLKECVQALREQTYPLAKIIVVNNHSTDDTQAYLDDLAQEDSRVVPVELRDNVGGSGGFNNGLKYFMRYTKDDFAWVMDDDTIPTADALKALMAKENQMHDKADIGFLCSNVRWKDGSPAVMNVQAPAKDWDKYSDDDVTKVASSSFVSVLLPRQVIATVGYPIKPFFIWGDDIEYTERVIKAGFEGLFVGDSLIHHKMAHNIVNDIVKENDNVPRIQRYYYEYRNRLYMARKNGGRDLAETLLRRLYAFLRILALPTQYRGLKVRTILKGTLAGFFFNPQIEKD